MNFHFDMLVVGLMNAFFCWGFISIYRRWAIRKQMLDNPSERSSHSRPIPTGAGLGIVLAILAAGPALTLGFAHQRLYLSFSPTQIFLLTAGALLIAAISFIDDIQSGLSPGLRLAVHFTAAALALIAVGGWKLVILPFLGTLNFGPAGYFITVVWIVGLINAFNFMDGIDGIAGVQAFIAAMGWLAVGLLSGSDFLAAAGIVIGSAAIGFLFHNWPPAKIFMGDIGSAFLGYCFAILPLYAFSFFSGSYRGRVPVAGLLMVAPFVMDTSLTLLRRLAKKEKLSQAHRSHLYQRLVISGLSHRTVTILYFILAAFSTAAGLGFLFLPERLLANILAAAAVIISLLIPLVWIWLRKK